MSDPMESLPNLISVSSLPVRPKWYDGPCSKQQREELDRLRMAYGHSYTTFLDKVKEQVEMIVSEHGKLTRKQAGKMIRYYKGLLNR